MSKKGLVFFTVMMLVIASIVKYQEQLAPLTAQITSQLSKSADSLNEMYVSFFNIQHQETPVPNSKMKILLNGSSEFSFINSPKYDRTLWLPGSEVMRLFDYRHVSIEDAKVSCGHFDDEGNYQFAFYQSDNFGYSIDADSNDYLTSNLKPYHFNGEIYVPESSIEMLTGDVFSFDEKTNTLNILQESYTELQKDNHQPAKKIVMKESKELNDNRISDYAYDLIIYTGFWDEASFEQAQNHYPGWKWVNINPENHNWQETNWELPDFYMNEKMAGYFNVVDDQGLSISYNLTFKDKEFLGDSHREGGSLHDPAQVERYLLYIDKVVNYFKGVVDCYEIWYEPDMENSPSFVSLQDYIAVIKQAYPLIKSIDANAKVSIGQTTPNYEDLTWQYLNALVSSDVVQYADRITFPPFFLVSPERFPEYYYEYPELINGIIEKAVQDGYQGDFWAGEGDYCPREFGPDMVDGFQTYTETVSTKYLQRINAINLGVGLSGGTMGTTNSHLSFDALGRSALLFSGVRSADYGISIQSNQQPVRSYSYDVDMGKLFSYWYDGIATEAKQFSYTDIILETASRDQVYAYDVLSGFYKELNYTIMNENIMLKGMVIRDYPIFILVE